MKLRALSISLFSISLALAYLLGDIPSTWSSGSNYSSGDLVIYNGTTYQAQQLINNSQIAPSSDATAWQSLDQIADEMDTPSGKPSTTPDTSSLPTAPDTNDSSTLTGGRLINLSTRGYVGTGELRLIGGFKVYGSSLPIIVRGFGPSHDLSVKSLDDPVLTWKISPPSLLPDSDGVINEVDDASGNSNLVDANEVAQSKIDKLIDKETADIQTASNFDNNRSKGYTAYIVAKTDGEAGVGRIGINDITDFTGDGQLVNISTRGYVGENSEHYLIAGFNIRDGNLTVCIRAFGPSMNLGDTGVLSDPKVELIQQISEYHDEKKVLAINDNWKESFTGTTDIAPFNISSSASEVPYYLNKKLLDKESTIVMTLEAGNYTARVMGVGGAEGVGRVGIDKIVDEWDVE